MKKPIDVVASTGRKSLNIFFNLIIQNYEI